MNPRTHGGVRQFRGLVWETRPGAGRETKGNCKDGTVGGNGFMSSEKHPCWADFGTDDPRISHLTIQHECPHISLLVMTYGSTNQQHKTRVPSHESTLTCLFTTRACLKYSDSPNGQIPSAAPQDKVEIQASEKCPAVADSRLALQLRPVIVPNTWHGCPCVVLSCQHLPVSGSSNLRVDCFWTDHEQWEKCKS